MHLPTPVFDETGKRLMRTHLTEIAVRGLKPVPGKQVKVWDTSTPGFGVRVNDRSKSWIVMFGKERRLKVLGQWPSMSLSVARNEAKRLLIEPPQKVDLTTFETALTLFLDQHYTDKRLRTKKEAKRLLEKHLLPKLRRRPLSEITDADIDKELRKLDHVPSEKLHCFRIARTFFKWCTRPPRRYIKHSPLEGFLAPSQDGRRERILSDDELKQIWCAATGTFGSIVRLLVVWGLRKGEVGVLKREWIVDGVLTIPPAYTKNGRSHTLPVLPLAQSILDGIPKRGMYFFPGRWDEETHFHDGSWSKLKRELDQRSGVQNWTIHDLRRTFRSTLPRLGVRREVAEVLMNHVSGANKSVLDEIYDRYEYLEEKRDALTRYEAWLERLLPKA